MMSANNTPRQRAVPRVALLLDRSGGANSADAAGADINKIVAQFRKNGTLPVVPNNNPLYGDFTFPEDIHSVREAVDQAGDRFQQLPASVRTLCENDWVKFYDLFHTTEGREKLIEAGLQITNTPQTTEPTPPTPTPPATPPTPNPDPEPTPEPNP